MRKFSLMMLVILIFSTASSLKAGEVIFYGGLQKPGKLSYSSPAAIPEDLLTGDFGGTVGLRYSAGRMIGFEQNISYSPRFAKPGVKAFQTDSNLVIQAPGKVVPYVTAGVGFVRSWGQDFPSDLNPQKIAAFAFSFGNSFAVNYGGGIKVRRILGPLGLNVDIRGYTAPDVRNGTLNFVQTSFGAVLNW